MRVDDSPVRSGLPEWMPGAVLRPGEAIAAWLNQHAPALSSWLSELFQDHLTLVLSAAGWLVLTVIGYALMRSGQKAFLAGRTLVTRLRISSIAFISYLKSGTLARLPGVLASGSSQGVSHEEIELSDLDLAVLRMSATLPPGYAISVVELAERLRERPSQVERSLIRLRRHQLVDPLLGSTDGFNDYRLTDSGTWFVSRQLAEQGKVLKKARPVPRHDTVE